MKNIKIIGAKYFHKKAIMIFFNSYWREKHILSTNKKLFDTFYKDKNNLNFLIALNNKNKIVGILGFIKNSKFNLQRKGVVWTSVLKALDEYPMLGFFLVKKLMDKFSKYDVGCMGNNIQSEKLFKLCGFKTGFLNQYYIINSAIKKFNILKINKNNFNLLKKKNSKKINFNNKVKLIEINKKNFYYLNNFKCNDKNEKYILNKYIKNKYYKYKVFAIMNSNEVINILVVRICSYSKFKVARVIDFLGSFENFYKVIDLLDENIKKWNVEYIDFCTSKKLKVYKNSLFKINNFNKDIILPNYFEPFVQKNHKIRYGILSRKNFNRYYFFKGDGDSERPNIL